MELAVIYTTVSDGVTVSIPVISDRVYFGKTQQDALNAMMSDLETKKFLAEEQFLDETE